MSDEMIRMNLVGLAPEQVSRIKRRAAEVIRAFDGAPENAAEFAEAQRLWRIIEGIEGQLPARHGLDEDPPRCHDCGHLFDDGCGCTCCYDYDDDESTGYPQDVHR